MTDELMLLSLIRTDDTADGVFGEMHIPAGPGGPALTLHTVEDDNLQNRRGVSCIPAGLYLLRRTMFYRHGYEAFEVTGVPGRSRILIHVANTENDVEGCIGVGLRRGVLLVSTDEDTGLPNAEKRAVVASREAFRVLMSRLAHTDEAMLSVAWAPGLPGLAAKLAA